MLREHSERANDNRGAHRATSGPPRATRPQKPSFKDGFCGLALLRAIEAELDDAGGDQAGALAAGVAGDVELRGERVEAALGGALADVERLGELGAGRWTTGEGARAAVGGDKRCRGRPLLLAERDGRFARRDGRPRPTRDGVGDFEPVVRDGQHVAVTQPAWAVEWLAVQRRPVAAVEVGRHQHPAAALDLKVMPGDRVVVDADVGLWIAPDRDPRPQRHGARLPTLTRQPDPRVHRTDDFTSRPASIESPPVRVDDEKRIAAEAAALLVEDGMTIGLGTGSTVAHLLPAIAARGLSGIRCVATSVATEDQARELGIPVEEFSELDRLDIAIDGTDQVTPDGWLIKGGGAAHQREKVVAAAARRFVVIADSSKPVDLLSAPVPLELLAFGLRSTLARLGAEVELREAPRSPDGGVIADYRGEIGNPATLAIRLEADPGISSHGLFPPDMVSEVLVGAGDSVSRLTLS